DDLAWSLYILDLGIWFYLFLVAAWVVALFVWSILLWAMAPLPPRGEDLEAATEGPELNLRDYRGQSVEVDPDTWKVSPLDPPTDAGDSSREDLPDYDRSSGDESEADVTEQMGSMSLDPSVAAGEPGISLAKLGREGLAVRKQPQRHPLLGLGPKSALGSFKKLPLPPKP
ncbi:unnamed protein product, partial [Symbiodinium sp. KB8]